MSLKPPKKSDLDNGWMNARISAGNLNRTVSSSFTLSCRLHKCVTVFLTSSQAQHRMVAAWL